MKKADLYQWIKIAGFLSFIPAVLVAGPLIGFFTGELLVKKFKLPEYIIFICIGIGFLGSAVETIKIIKATLRQESKR